MCHGPYRAAAHGLAGGDATRRSTTHHFGPVRRSGASIRHGGVLSGNCKTLSQDPGGSMELFGLRADYRLRLRTQRRRRRHTIDSGAIFSGAVFRGVVFAGAVFRGADLSRAALAGAVFGSAVFSSGVFARAVFRARTRACCLENGVHDPVRHPPSNHGLPFLFPTWLASWNTEC